MWCPSTLCAVIWDATASGTALAVARYGIRQFALLRLGTAADLSVLPSYPQLLPSLPQHPSTQCEVICNAAAGGAALANARYGSRLLTTPYIRTTAVKRELPSCPQLLPILLQHPTPRSEVVGNAAAGGVALANARYGSRLSQHHASARLQSRAAFVSTTDNQLVAAFHHAARSGLPCCSQRRCTSRRP